MKTYHSKLLLFGEHTIVKGSRALAMPYTRYGAKWSFESGENRQVSASALSDFHIYLSNNRDDFHYLNVAAFSEDLSKGIWLDADIPKGYGLGSSGSVCAAIYDRYGVNKIVGEDSEDLKELKMIFARMESHFHGTSSGTDPLICYLNEAVLMSTTNLERVSVPHLNEGQGGMFLLNTHIARKTGPLVNLFLEKCKNPIFNQLISNEFAIYTDICIDAFLQKNKLALFDNLRKLSTFQYQYLQEMIPEKYRQIWSDGLDSGDYTLKLCGAGGGGFILGFTEDFDRMDLSDIEVVFRF